MTVPQPAVFSCTIIHTTPSGGQSVLDGDSPSAGVWSKRHERRNQWVSIFFFNKKNPRMPSQCQHRTTLSLLLLYCFFSCSVSCIECSVEAVLTQFSWNQTVFWRVCFQTVSILKYWSTHTLVFDAAQADWNRQVREANGQEKVQTGSAVGCGDPSFRDEMTEWKSGI